MNIILVINHPQICSEGTDQTDLLIMLKCVCNLQHLRMKINNLYMYMFSETVGYRGVHFIISL